MELDLSLAASFAVLAEEGHYGRAAARLSVTSPALTKRVQRLERDLDVRLLERGPGGVVALTPAGLRLADEVGPLLAHARATRSLVGHDRPSRAGPAGRPAAPPETGSHVVRFGVPAGSAATMRHLDLRRVASQLRREVPGTRLVGVDVAFGDMTRCLPDGQVDVLWTDAPVEHSSVESVRLGLSSRRTALVGPGHRLAGATTVAVADLVDEPMLYNPAVPQEWMAPFWLGDLRSLTEARLVPVDAGDYAAVVAATSRLGAVTLTLEAGAALFGSAQHRLVLHDAPPVVFHAAHRRREPRAAVHAVIRSLLGLGTRDLGTAGSGTEPAVASPHRPREAAGAAPTRPLAGGSGL